MANKNVELLYEIEFTMLNSCLIIIHVLDHSIAKEANNGMPM